MPYVMDPAMSAEHREVYLDGLREYELAANVHFVPRTAETQYVLFKYAPFGPNRVSGSNPQTVEIGLLTRGQICHEMGHSFGLEHEHQRADRGAYVEVLGANIYPGNEALFQIATGTTMFGSYDFESVMHYGRDTLSVQPGVLDTLQVKAGYTKYQKRMGNFALSPGDRALMAYLYGPPTVPPSAVVTTTADGGPGSLRAAMYFAADHPGVSVSFNIPVADPGHSAGTFTIRPTGYLPPLASNGLIIDGRTQPGYAGNPLVFLDGSELIAESGSIPGLFFYESNCAVKGLGFRRFPWVGIAMLYPEATGNTVSACWSGLDATGNAAAPNALQGIYIAEGAHDNAIDGCVLSGNTQYGAWVSGPATSGNVVRNSRIGTNANGTAAVKNNSGGIIFTDATHHGTIENNLISGNTDAGLWITGEGVDHHLIRGNRVGTNAAGTAAIPNTFVGAYIIDGASDNLIENNLFSGNQNEGLRLAGSGTVRNTVRNNRAGTSADGSSAISNGFTGVAMLGGTKDNLIENNHISGNGVVGLTFGDPGTSGNRAFRNYIGTDASGTQPLPNGYAGVYLVSGCDGNQVGDGPGTGNLISSNLSAGIFIDATGPAGNRIRNNLIGPDRYGDVVFDLQSEGILINPGLAGTEVGGSQPGAANVIRGNSRRGIVVFQSGSTNNSFRRNSISRNGWDGIELNDGSNHAIQAPHLSGAALALATHVSGTFRGNASESYRIEYFASAAASMSSGEVFLGERTVTADGNGSADIDTSLPAIVPAGRVITVTATSLATGDTSEFSNGMTVSVVDSDSDGMPDAYENSVMGLSKTNGADAALDTDGDGMSNLAEFHAGTDPRNTASRLSATGKRSQDIFTITFPTVAGVAYRVEAADSLPGLWRAAAVNLIGSGGLMEVTFPAQPGLSKEFWRVASGG